MNRHPEQALTTYLVGGAVRDRLLGFTKADRDFVVIGSSPEQMLALGFQQVGKHFPVFLHPYSREEYALARIEHKVKPGHQGFECEYSPHVSLEEDLKRRDLTINAMAMTQDGQLIDPYQGQRDLHHRLLRHVSPAFREDPLRILRVARFAARFFSLEFHIAEETLSLMRTMCIAGELNTLSAERIWREIQLGLQTDHPATMIEVLCSTGAFQALFPIWSNIPIHIMENMLACLSMATSECHTVLIRFGAFMAPLHTIPKLGLEFHSAFCERVSPPKAFSCLTLDAIQTLNAIQHYTAYSATAIVEQFYQLDAYRRPDRFFNLLILADIESRASQHKTSTQDLAKLKAIFLATQTITAQPFLQEGKTGLALKQAIFEARVSAAKSTSQGFSL